MPQSVRFDLFSTASPMGRDLVLHWHQRAKYEHQEDQYDSFDAFTRLWTGFNNWAMRVTEAETDADMIRRLAESRALNRAFEALFEDDHHLRAYARVFAKFWPIFNVKDIRKKGHQHKFDHLDRSTYSKKLIAAHVKHAPTGKFDRDKPRWDETIRAIYQVRCNLIHGEKGDSSEDYNIVEGAYRTLLTFIDGVDLYHWPDVEIAQKYM